MGTTPHFYLGEGKMPSQDEIFSYSNRAVIYWSKVKTSECIFYV